MLIVQFALVDDSKIWIALVSDYTCCRRAALWFPHRLECTRISQRHFPFPSIFPSLRFFRSCRQLRLEHYYIYYPYCCHSRLCWRVRGNCGKIYTLRRRIIRTVSWCPFHRVVSRSQVVFRYSKTDGSQLSAVDLTWSYASALTAFDARAGVVPASWGAQGLTSTCGISTGGGGGAGTVAVTFNVDAITVFGGTSGYPLIR